MNFKLDDLTKDELKDILKWRQKSKFKPYLYAALTVLITGALGLMVWMLSVVSDGNIKYTPIDTDTEYHEIELKDTFFRPGKLIIEEVEYFPPVRGNPILFTWSAILLLFGALGSLGISAYDEGQKEKSVKKYFESHYEYTPKKNPKE